MKESDFTAEDSERFWSKVIVSNCRECWIWNGAKSGDGYGRFGFKGKNRMAPRVAYLMSVGEIPQGMCVCHTCDNPPCVNPSHLWLGTRAENNHDCSRKGRVSKVGSEFIKKLRQTNPERFARGERQGSSKLTSKDVNEIRTQYRGGALQRELGDIYGVNQVTISAIVRNRSWRHLL